MMLAGQTTGPQIGYAHEMGRAGFRCVPAEFRSSP